MMVENLDTVKESIKEELVKKDIFIAMSAVMLDMIQPNSYLHAYCHKCKTIAKIDFIRFDSNLMMHCNWCDVDIMDLDTELYKFVHYNVIKKLGEKYEQ